MTLMLAGAGSKEAVRQESDDVVCRLCSSVSRQERLNADIGLAKALEVDTSMSIPNPYMH